MRTQKPFIRYQAALLSILWTLAMPFGASTAQAALTCRRAYVEFGAIRPNFKHNTHYTVEVGDQPEVMNQCNFGSCHLHAWASSLEHNYKVTHNGKEIKISMHYLTAGLWLTRAIETLFSPDLSYQVPMGASPAASRDFILANGIIPESAWTGSTDFEQGAKALRLQQMTQNIIARAKLESSEAKTATEKLTILQNAQNDIVSIFKQLIPSLPTQFRYGRQTYTPQTFATTFFPELLQPVVTILQNVSPAERKATAPSKNPNDILLNARTDQVEAAAREALDHGVDVFLGYDHDNTFVDLKTGIMSISAFGAPESAAPLSLNQRVGVFKMTTGGHAVQIVGYDLDPKTKRVKKWKIKNSWGRNAGDHGYFHMYADYFQKYVIAISFQKTDDISLSKIETIPDPVEPEQGDLFK